MSIFNIVFTDLTEIGTGGSCAPAIEIDLTEEIDWKAYRIWFT